MKRPGLKFEKWHKWEERDEFPGIEHPGVYCIAISKENLEEKEFDYKDVSYIGMTVSRGGLRSRWCQFDRSIHRGKRGHSGGNTMRKEKGLYQEWKEERLFVTASPVKCTTLKDKRTQEDLIKMGWVAFMEYEALANFKRETDDEPRYNKK